MGNEAQRAEWREHNRRRRVAAKKSGICSTCLAREVEKGKGQCTVCRKKRRAAGSAWSAE